MTNYRFWSGLDSIGGNIVEVRTKQARVICDFGLSVSERTMEKPVGMSEAEYLILEKQLPAIPGLYDSTEFQQLELESYQDETLEMALFISHLHLDHMGGLQYLPAGTIVYLSKESYDLYQILLEVGEETPVQVELRPLDYDETVTVGDIQVTPKHTDHDAAGAVAFFIETDELHLIHSGDVRLTGNYPERVEKWTKEAAEWGTDVLLLEGTSYSFEEEPQEIEMVEEDKFIRPRSEKELLEAMTEILNNNTKDIVFYNPYIRNVERMKDVAEVVAASGREMVFEESYARVLHAIYPGSTWTVLEETVRLEETPFMEKAVTLAEVSNHPSRYVLQNSWNNLSFVEAFKVGIYCHSNGEPLGDYDSRYAVMLDKLIENQFKFIEMGTSGHAGQEELIEIARNVQATVTVPWHTFRPEVFYDALESKGIAAILPEKNKFYEKQLQR